MSLPEPYASAIKKSFKKSIEGTASKEKKVALEEMKNELLKIEDPEEACKRFADAIGDPKSVFSKAIDIKTGLGGWISAAPSASRNEMTELSNKLDSYLSDGKSIAKSQLKDSSGKGFGEVIKNSGANDALQGAYDVTTAKQTEIDQVIKDTEAKRLISHGDIRNLFNKSGLDYKGQTNYASLTLMKGAGLNFNADFAALFFPPAAAAGLELSASASAGALKGVQRFVYTEVTNGNNGGWQLPSSNSIKNTLCDQITSNLNKLDSGYFDTVAIKEHLLATLDADDFNSADKILDCLLVIPLGKADATTPGTEYVTYEDEIAYPALKLHEAVLHSCEATESLLTKLPLDRDRYTKLVVAGCMQSVAWEWRATVGTQASFSPFNIESIKNVTKYIESSKNWGSSKALQYVSLSVSCSLTAEAALSGTRRSFYATDKNARIFASGDDDFSKNTSQDFTTYIANAIRFSTEQSVRDYVRYRLSLIVDKKVGTRSFCNPLQIEQYNRIFEPGKLQSIRNIISAPTLKDIHSLCESMKGNAENISRAYKSDKDKIELYRIDREIETMCRLLEEFETQESEPDLGRFSLAYTGTQGSASASASGKAGISITGIANAQAAAKVLSLFKAAHRSNYVLQTPVVNTNRHTGRLPDLVRGSLGAGNGSATIRDLCSHEPDPPIPGGLLLTKTQETTVWYRQSTFAAIEEWSASAKIGSFNAEKNSNADAKGVTPAKSPVFNNIEYHSATAVWFPEGDFLRLTDGSGRAYGQTMLLDELLSLAKSVRVGATLSADVEEKLSIIARSLHTTPIKIKEFFRGTQNLAQLDELAPQNWANQEGAVLIEAIHALSDVKTAVYLKKKKVVLAEKLGRTANGINNIPESPLASEALPEVDPRNSTYTLQSIRIRYRLADIADRSSDSSLFTLGIPKATGLSLGVTLSEVDVAGTSGVVDLLTYWFSGTRASESLFNVGTAGSLIYNRADSVQATVLILQ